VKKKFGLFLAAACAIGCWSAAHAEDPYAAQQQGLNDGLQQRQAETLIDDTRLVHYAVGCNVVNAFAAKHVLYDRFRYVRGRDPDFIFGLEKKLEGAKRAGLVESGLAGDNDAESIERARPRLVGNNCGYWHEHPEAVARMRMYVGRWN